MNDQNQPAETISTRPMLRRLLRIGLPMMVSHASESVMLFVDRLFLSRVGKVHLAAAMTGGVVTFNVAMLFGGITGYVNAIVAQYHGANQDDQCANATVQTIYLSFFALPILVLVAILIPGFFRLMGHDAAQLPLETTYARWLISGSVLMLMRNGLTGFFVGIGRTRVVMVANISAMLVNLPLNYVLIFGKLGFPALGMIGAAIGTIGGSLTAFTILLSVYLSRRVHAQYGTRSVWKFDGRMFLRLIRFGFPAGLEMFLTVLAFNIFVQLMHSYGPDVAAATTIAFNWDLVSFIPMLGLGAATTSLVGQHVGASDPEGGRRMTLLGVRVALVYAATLAVLYFTAARPLVTLFAAGFGAAGPTADLARQMLRLVGLYTVADSAQLVFSGALRGAGDTRWVMRASVTLHWIFAAVSVTMIRFLSVAPFTMWLVLIGFVLSLSITMLLRFRGGKWMSMKVI